MINKASLIFSAKRQNKVMPGALGRRNGGGENAVSGCAGAGVSVLDGYMMNSG
ncbi:MAG TPA: hypothetical protein IAB00_06520 [Candidatus Avidehalobacter gallistercoris]|uniref:Uncharacterized protein n=1 Tax=Candidatus Avidehalobacter gallistercoris TaxID=2840694 RepID=A0A9D1KZ22_9FIRM|nr:hypothetical protein [Candidatus Avidehalobacter gallistercoris]